MAVVGNWTYSGDPRDSDRDSVRFLVGDTDDTDQKVSDEEIAYLLTQNGNVFKAAAMAARGISANYTVKVKEKKIGDLAITYADRAKSYIELAIRLEAQAADGSILALVPYAGGISVSDKATQTQDTDWDTPSFWRGQFDYPGSNWPLGGSSS